ncbi:ribonuclease P protein component [bacterium]|nr:ribonuclease P protein component [bacterium]
MALPLKFRLKGRRAFDEFRGNALVYFQRNIVLKVVDCKDNMAFGFVIPKRVGKAVKRNRIRRVLSEWIRINIGMFPSNKHYLIIIRHGKRSSKKIIKEICELAKRVTDAG